MTAPGGQVRIGCAVRSRSRVGEGPVWDASGGRLWWVDILAGMVHATALHGSPHPRPTGTSTISCPTWIGAVAPRRTGGLVAATRTGFAAISADGRYDDRMTFLPSGTRMNDAACDPAGRFWAGGTDERFAAGAGPLHVLDPGWEHQVVLDGLTQPNGLGWSPDGRTFYLVDSAERVIWSYDFDVATAAAGGQQAGLRPVSR